MSDRRAAVSTLLPWLALGLVQLYFAWRSLVQPPVLQLVGEFGALVLLGVSQSVLGRGWWRSTLMAGAAGCAVGLHVLGPGGPVLGTIFLIGVLVIVLGAVRRVERWRCPGVAVGMVFAVFGAIGARYGVLLELTGQQIEALRGGAAEAALRRLAFELQEPGQRSMPDSSSDGPPLVLVSVDTLRADDAKQMAVYQRLAARGASWPAAMSTSSWTLPATASLATGELTEGHGAGFHPSGQYQGIAAGVATLAEDLKAAGYSTAAIASNPWVSRDMGFDRGFDRFVQVLDFFPHRLLVTGTPRTDVLPNEAGPVVERAIRWISSAPDRGWYLWVHIIDPHMPYQRASDARFHGVTSADLRAGELVTPDERIAMREAYREMVGITDAALGPLLDALEAKGVFDDGLVAFTSDHGEEFWEHRGVGHGHSHHGEVLDVPLVLVAPGLRPGVRTEAASIADIASTFRAAAGVAPGGVDLRDEQPADRVVTAWGNLHFEIERSARNGTARVIVDEESGHAERYELVSDPLEKDGVTPSADDSLWAAALGVEVPPLGVSVDLDDLRALEALGYVD